METKPPLVEYQVNIKLYAPDKQDNRRLDAVLVFDLQQAIETLLYNTTQHYPNEIVVTVGRVR